MAVKKDILDIRGTKNHRKRGTNPRFDWNVICGKGKQGGDHLRYEKPEGTGDEG